MKTLKVYRHYFTDSDCYNSHNIQIPKGVQVHSTGANNPYLKRYVGPDDGRLGVNKYNNHHNRKGLTVCANAYIGKLEDGTVAIYQALPWDQRCWLSGSSSAGNANKLGYVGFEICEDNLKDKAYFEDAVMNKSVLLTAWLCQEYNIPISNVHDHCELHSMGLASNHGDIQHWLKLYGLTMTDYRIAVQAAIDEGIQIIYDDEPEEEIPDVPQTTLYQATVVAKTGSTVNFRSSPSKNAQIIAKIPFGTIVDVLQEVNTEWAKIQYNGTKGYMMREFLVKENNKTLYEQLQQIRAQVVDTLTLIDNLLTTIKEK